MDECMVPSVCQGLGKLLAFLMWKQFEGGSLLSITTVSVALRSVKLLRVNETVIASEEPHYTGILNILHYDHLQVCTLFRLSSRKWSHALMFRKHYFSHALRVWTPMFDCLSTDFWPPAVVTLCHSADWMSGMLTSSMDAVVAGHKYCTATTPRCRLV